MLTGGRNSYGPGGYFRSSLDPILPVSMELRNEHRKLSLAMVVALDRSGSMAVPVGGGKAKMDLANEGAAQVVDLLGPMDEFGVIAIDTAPHLIADLAPVRDKETVKSDIRSIRSEGGGIFIYVALESAAAMLLKATAGTKHIILFADANDSEEPGQYKELLDKCKEAGITVSVIGLGTPADKDAGLLRDIAERGNGRIFFTDKPEELPRLFAQDTFVVARNTFLDEPTPIASTPGLSLLAGRPFDLSQTIGGYNLTYLRSGATLATRTLDDYKAPVVAAWRAGAGRVLCYTGEADGKYAGPIAGWKDVGAYYSSLARWTIGPSNRLPADMLLTQEVKNGLHQVQLHLDPERQGDPFAELPRVTLLRTAGPAAGSPQDGAALDGCRHARPGDRPARSGYDAGHDRGAGSGTGGAAAGVSAVFAGVSAGRGRSGAGDTGAIGPGDRRQGARRSGRCVEGTATACAVRFARAVASGCGRGFIPAGSV